MGRVYGARVDEPGPEFPLTPDAADATPRPSFRVAVGATAAAAVLAVALLVAVVARPALLVAPANWALDDSAIRLSVGSARLEAPTGWLQPTSWRWRITGFSLTSHQPGIPTLEAETLLVRLPLLGRSYDERSVVLPQVDAEALSVSVLAPGEPETFEEVEAWPLRGLVVDRVVLREFELDLGEASGSSIVLDRVDGEVVDFRYDFGRRLLFGHGETEGARLVVGPIDAVDVAASPVTFSGSTVQARGFGRVGGQRAAVSLSVEGLLRPAARIHAEFDVERAELRALLTEVLGAGAPDVNGALSGRAVFDSEPPASVLSMTFRLDQGEVALSEDTKGIVLTALKLAPVVELDDYVLRLGTLSGRVHLADEVLTLRDGRYEADRTTAHVEGRVDRTSLHGRVWFGRAPGQGGVSWGLLMSGSPSTPKLALAEPRVLEAWSMDGSSTPPAIRQAIRDARRQRRDAASE